MRLGALITVSAVAVVAISVPGTAAATTLNRLASVQIVGNVPFDDQLQTAKKLGFRRVRLAAYWSQVERPRGQYVWRSTDARIGAVLKAGLVPIVTIFGTNDGYSSSDRENNAPPVQGEALAGFAKFAAATVLRYGTGTADVPILYEIWNEPNTKTFWKRVPDPEGYAGMAEAACHAIRSVAPQARVLALGMEGWPVKAPYRVQAYKIDIYQEWALRAATPDLMACVDGISFHPYLPRPEQVLEGEGRLSAYIARVWRRPSPPLIANTEWGYSGGNGGGRDPATQAALDLRALLIGAGVGRVTNLYQSVDTGRDPTKGDQNYGLVTIGGVIKPAGLGVRRLLQAIGDFEIDGVAKVDGTPGLYRFVAHRGRDRAQVVWSTAAGGTTTSVSAQATVVDLVAGTPVVHQGTATVGAAPFLILQSAPPLP